MKRPDVLVVFLCLLALLIFRHAKGQDLLTQSFNLKIRADSESPQQKATDYYQSLVLAVKAVEQAPNDANTLQWAGWVAYANFFFSEEAAYAKQAIAADASRYDSYLVAAHNLQALGQVSMARQYYQEALRHNPDKDHYTEAITCLKAISERQYDVIWRIPATSVIRVPIPPENLPSQNCDFSVTGGTFSQTAEDGNPMAVIAPTGPEVTVTLHVTVHPYSWKSRILAAKSKISGAPYPPHAAKWLENSQYISGSGPQIQRALSELASTDDAAKRVHDITVWLSQHISYRIENAWAPVEELMGRQWAECGGFTRLFCSMARASGIPARFAWVLVHDPKVPAGHLKGHGIAEVYLKGVGWVPVDPQNTASFGLLPTDYITICYFNEKKWQNQQLGPDGDTPQFKEITAH